MVTYTSSSLYWSPLKPRIRIYSFGDSTYSNPLYTYDPFTDIGSSTKPIALNFDSQTTNVGTFSIEIEDRDYELDPDTFMRGNRVSIDCSKDGITYQPAFKGLVRSTDQNIYAITGRNLVINGYSYLVRLNERVLNTIQESNSIGEEYDRADSRMFTDNLINDLLTTNSNYVYSDDDTALYNIFKKTNITSSPVTDWIPRLDAQLVTVNEAINSVLEFSNSLVMLNPADDELVLYNPDAVTSGTGIFLLTNQINQNADDADYTMYPLESYKYNISYDYPDSGSRLIGSIGETGSEECPPEDQVFTSGLCGGYTATTSAQYGPNWRATQFISDIEGAIRGLAIAVYTSGNISGFTSNPARIYTNGSGPTGTEPGTQLGTTLTLYRNGKPGTAFPSSAITCMILGMEGTAVGPSLTIGATYWVVLYNTSMTSTNNIHWITDWSGETTFARFAVSSDSGNTWSGNGNTAAAGGTYLRLEFTGGGAGACGGGGVQATIDADPVFAVAHDRNMTNRLGVVEKVMTAIPTHIKKRASLQEYLFNKLYYSAKPRFTFDFPSVSMPNKLPKAGDIVAHVDTKIRVGTTTAPIQTGVISQVAYDFAQGTGENDALGLRKLSLSTTGIRRGSY